MWGQGLDASTQAPVTISPPDAFDLGIDVDQDHDVNAAAFVRGWRAQAQVPEGTQGLRVVVRAPYADSVAGGSIHAFVEPTSVHDRALVLRCRYRLLGIVGAQEQAHHFPDLPGPSVSSSVASIGPTGPLAFTHGLLQHCVNHRILHSGLA